MALMSRLNFMEEQELAIQAIAEELVQLEKLVAKGEEVAPELAQLFDSCVKRAVRIQKSIRRLDSNLPLRNWMQKTDRRAIVSGKTRRPELVKRS